MFHGRCTGPSAIAPSPLPRQRFRMRCRQRSRRCCRWGHSSVHWRWNCSADYTAMQTIGHSSIDISVIHDTQRPSSFVQDLRRDEIHGWWWWWTVHWMQWSWQHVPHRRISSSERPITQVSLAAWHDTCEWLAHWFRSTRPIYVGPG